MASGGGGAAGGAARLVNVGGVVAGPGGVVRRPTLNAIVVNTCQVSRGAPVREERADAVGANAEGEPDHCAYP